MGADLGFIHHVGHVVRDMRPALDLYRRLGFDFGPPAYPMLSPRAGESPRPFGAANTHMSFPRSFVELATVVSDNIPPPSDARLIPLQVSPAALPRTLETIKGTVDGLAADLARFEGLHILVLGSPDATASAAILDKDGIRHSGPNLVQRPLDTTAGPVMASVKYVEIDRQATPEGRLAIAENPPPAIQHAQAQMDHPNGAIDLSESILCTPDAEYDSYIERYRRLLGRAPRAAGEAQIFDLDDARITLLPGAALPRVLPGELPPAVPAFVGYAVRVRDLLATMSLLHANGIPTTQLPSEAILVPSKAALGAAIVFRQS